MSRERLTEIHGHGQVRRLQTRTPIRAPIDTVWDALTKIEHVSQWWADGAIGNGPGEVFQLGGENDLNGTIIAMFKPHVFEFTWQDDLQRAAHPEWIEPATRSLVRFDLIEIDAAETLLNLVSFAPLIGASGAAAGWHHIFEIFAAYVEGRDDVDPSGERFEALKTLYAT